MGTEHSEEKKTSKFIKETIAKRPLSPREKWKKFFLFCLAALCFGAVAGTAFALSSHVVTRGLGGQETEEPSFTIPYDEETPSETEPAETTSSPSTSQAAEESFEDWKKQLERQASFSLVTVRITATGTDSFNNILENEKECSGIIIGQSGDEYLILTSWTPLSQAESISVSFYNSTWAQASLRGKDSQTDIAVLAVSRDNILSFGADSIKAVELGNSYQAMQGDRILAVGSPFGIADTSAAGYVVATGSDEEGIDGRLQILYSDIGASSDGMGFLLDEEGKLIGILTGRYSGTQNGVLTVSVGISDLKQVLTSLGQGQELAYFGCRLQEVDKTTSTETGLPDGLYVTEVLQESPAYEAGIQPGDIIRSLDGEEMATIKEFRNALLLRQPGERITVTVQRSGKNGYSDIEFSATLGSR